MPVMQSGELVPSQKMKAGFEAKVKLLFVVYGKNIWLGFLAFGFASIMSAQRWVVLQLTSLVHHLVAAVTFFLI